MSKIKGKLIDASVIGTEKLPVEIELTAGKIFFRAKGYGDRSSLDGCGFPVVIENWGRELRVLIWSDINKEDPTHIISLEGAKESKRIKLDEKGNCIYCGQKCFQGQMCDEQQAGGFNKDHNKNMETQDDD